MRRAVSARSVALRVAAFRAAKNNNYYNDALLYHQGERVIVVYDPDNIDKIAVFDMENRVCHNLFIGYLHTLGPDFGVTARISVEPTAETVGKCTKKSLHSFK